MVMESAIHWQTVHGIWVSLTADGSVLNYSTARWNPVLRVDRTYIARTGSEESTEYSEDIVTGGWRVGEEYDHQGWHVCSTAPHPSPFTSALHLFCLSPPLIRPPIPSCPPKRGANPFPSKCASSTTSHSPNTNVNSSAFRFSTTS